MKTVVLSTYDWDKHETVKIAEVPASIIGKALDPEAMAEVLENRLNTGIGGRKFGIAVGQKMVECHRTLQGQFMEFVIGLILGYYEQYMKDWNGHTDARNEGAVNAARSLSMTIKEKELKQYFV